MPLPLGSEFQINSFTNGIQQKPVVATLSNENFIIAWHNAGQDFGGNISGQLFSNSGGKLGNEFQVNNYTLESQSEPAINVLNNDKFIVVWQSYGQDGSGHGVYGQLFDSMANKVNDEFQINTYTSNTQNTPIVTVLTNGNFVVVWESAGQDDPEAPFATGIYGKLFDENANQIGTEFQVNTNTIGEQSLPQITRLNNGNFVVVWQSDSQDLSGSGIYGQVFDGLGSKIGMEFQVNTYTINSQQREQITTLKNDNFVVVWESYLQDGSFYGIYGQVFNANGNKVGTEFSVNTYTPGYQDTPAICALNNGNFVVVWQSFLQDTSDYGIYSQLFDGEGNKISNEFRVNNYITNSQQDSSITALSGGNFLVAWSSYQQDGSNYGIYGQVFDAIGNKVDGEFRINSYTTNAQQIPKAITLSNGNILILWLSDIQDGSDYGIYGQLYYSPLIANNLNQQLNYMEDSPLNFNPIVISSAVNNTATANLILSPASAGSLSTNSAGNTTSTYQPTSGQWQASGPINEINSLLATTQFIPALNYNGVATINVTINDGVNQIPLQGIVNFTGIPITPLLQTSTSNLSYIENQANLVIDSNLTIIPELDTPMLPSATVSIVTNFETNEDVLGFINQNNITGIYDSQTGRLTLTGLSSTANYQAALRNVTYTNLSQNPSEQLRQVNFSINDGSVESPAANRAIEINAINDAPIVVNPLKNETIQTDTDFQFAVPVNTFVDPDNETLSFFAKTYDEQTLPSWLNFDPQNQIFSGHSLRNPSKNHFALWAQDSKNATVKTEFTIDVKAKPHVAEFPWWGILLSVVGGTALFGGTLGLSYWWYRRYRQAKVSLAALEMQEQPWVERANKGHTIIHNQFALINKITKEEAEELNVQEGIEVTFDEGKAKARFTLGQGQFGKLRLARDIQSGRFIGVKKIKGADNIEASQNEGKLQQQLNGLSNIMPLLKSVETMSSENQPVLYQFMPLAGFGNGNTLKEYLAYLTEPGLKQKLFLHVAKSLLLGLQAMHQHGIYHLDLKPSNFVVDIRGNLYIIDFGCAEQIDKKRNDSLLNGGRGDMRYYSPDRIANYCYCLNIQHENPIQYYDAALADAWALGLTLLEISLCYPLDDVSSIREITTYWDNYYFNKKLSKISELKDPAENSYWYLIKGLLTTDPSKRLSINQALALVACQKDTEQLMFSSAEEIQLAFITLKQLAQENKNNNNVQTLQVGNEKYSVRENYTTSSPNTYKQRSPRSSIFFAPVQPGSNYGNVNSSLPKPKDDDNYYSKQKISQNENNAQHNQTSSSGLYGNNNQSRI